MDSISDIDVNLLKIDNSQDGKFMNILCDDKPIVFATPSFPVPFGLEESYNNKFIKLSLRNIRKSPEAQELYTFIESIERKLIELIPNCNEIQSQLRNSAKYDPVLTVKIPMGKNAVIADVKDSTGAPFNLYGLGKGDFVRCVLVIDTVWYFRGKYSYKIKAKEIIVERS